MKKEDKKRWVAALRSGKYSQCTGRLHNPRTDSYCCLGIACEIFGVTDRNYINVWKDGWQGRLPLDLCKRFDMEDDGALEGKTPKKWGNYPSLVSLNDKGFTFEELADVIERHF